MNTFYVFCDMFMFFDGENNVFGLLDAKPYRTIVKLPQEVSFGPEACEIRPKVWFQASGFCPLRLGEPSGGNWGNPKGPPQVTTLYDAV